MGKLFTAAASILSAFRLCLFDRRYRDLAMRPWLIGIAVYGGSLVGALYAHQPILQRIVNEPEGFISWLVYGLAWIGVALSLLIGTMIISVAIIMVFSSLLQSGLARLALADLQIALPPEDSSLHGSVKEAARTVYVESTKLLWIIPLGITVFITGLFPLLLPLTILFVSWLLAYQFLDAVVDALKVPPLRRLKMAIRHGGGMFWFGLLLAGLWAIPLFGFLLPPIAVVAAALYFNSVGFLENIGATKPTRQL